MKFACFDVETVPSATLPPGVKPEFKRDSVKLGNTKDLIKIGEKISDAEGAFNKALDKKMSLDPDLCEVVCFVMYDADMDHLFGTHAPIVGIVAESWAFITDRYLNHIPLVSFNGINFDLPVLLHQAMRFGIPVSAQMYSDLTKKYENRWHYDLMQWLAGWDRSKYKPLSFYLRLYGIDEQSGDGSQVYDWYKSGDYDTIRTHCEMDVKLTAKLFEHLKDYIVKEV